MVSIPIYADITPPRLWRNRVGSSDQNCFSTKEQRFGDACASRAIIIDDGNGEADVAVVVSNVRNAKCHGAVHMQQDWRSEEDMQEVKRRAWTTYENAWLDDQSGRFSSHTVSLPHNAFSCISRGS